MEREGNEKQSETQKAKKRGGLSAEKTNETPGGKEQLGNNQEELSRKKMKVERGWGKSKGNRWIF